MNKVNNIFTMGILFYFWMREKKKARDRSPALDVFTTE